MKRPIALWVFVGVVAAGIMNFVLGLLGATVLWLAGDILGSGSSPVYVIFSLIAVGVGGFAAARLSGSMGFRASVAVGVSILVIQGAVALFRPDNLALWTQVLYFALLVPAAILGGRLARART
jgi:hypothetical protein